MDKKVLYALTTKIFSTLKKLGIKPKIGVTTDIQRLPGANSFNTDFSTLTQARPESLKKLITVDADFLAKANPDELRQYYNNLEYVQATYPEVFSKAEVVTESKTGLKTLVDDVNEKLQGKKSMETFDPKTGEVIIPKTPVSITEVIDEGIKKQADMARKGLDPANPDNYIKENKSRQLTREEIEDYEAQLGDAETWLSEGTVEEAEKALQRSKAEEAYYRGQYKAGKLDPASGEKSQNRLNFLRKKVEEAEMAGDKRLFTFDEMEELDRLESSFKKPEISEAEMIKQKYGNLIDDNLLKQILIDNNPQRKAEVMATIDEALKMQEKGMSQQEIIDIIKNTTRTKQAKGGLIKSITQKSMMSNLDRTLNKGLGTMFKRKR